MGKTPIPDDWSEIDGYSWAMFCLPNSVKWRAVVLGSLSDLAFGRYWDGFTGSIKDAQEQGEIIMESVTMGCENYFEEMVSKLQRIAIALENQMPCGCEGIGTEVPPGWQQLPPDIGEGTDFPTVGDYDNYKCAAANSIVRRLIQSQEVLIANNVQGYFGAAVGTVTGAVSFALKAAGLEPLLAGVGASANIILSLIQGEELTLTDVLDYLEANRADVVCTLYCSTSAPDAYNRMTSLLFESELTATEINYLASYLQPGILNWLFSYQESLAGETIVIECDTCDCSVVSCGFAFQVIGSDVLGSGEMRYDGLPFTLSSAPYSGVHLLNLSVPCGGESGCNSINWCVTILDTTINTTEGAGRTRRIAYYGDDCAIGQSIYDGSFPPIGTGYLAGGLEFTSAAPFEITFTFSGPFGSAGNPPVLTQCT